MMSVVLCLSGDNLLTSAFFVFLLGVYDLAGTQWSIVIAVDFIPQSVLSKPTKLIAERQ